MMMKTGANFASQRRQIQVRETLRANSESFNFDLWAMAVRQQMVAALQKRDNSD
jgi:hypothetical protein